MKKFMSFMTAAMFTATAVPYLASAQRNDDRMQQQDRDWQRGRGQQQQQQQQQQDQDWQRPQQRQQLGQSAHRASDLIGMKVKNQDETLTGQIKDIVLSNDGRKADALAVTFDQVDDRVFHLALQEQQDQQRFGRQQDRDQDQDQDQDQVQPRFGRQQNQDQDRDQRFVRQQERDQDGGIGGAISRMLRGYQEDAMIIDLDRNDLRSLQSYSEDGWADRFEKRLVSDVIDMRLRGRQDETIGRIRDLIIDVQSGEIAEASVGVGGLFGYREQLASIDWEQVRVGPDQDHATASIDQQQLERQAYDRDEYWQRLGFNGDNGRRRDGDRDRDRDRDLQDREDWRRPQQDDQGQDWQRRQQRNRQQQW